MLSGPVAGGVMGDVCGKEMDGDSPVDKVGSATTYLFY